ncbi:MAG: NAD+ synthase [Candidatus Omnitrophica bacterium]|nr:NAD+ synthase [Candidatus Omnitrophota bacterium]
MLNLRIGLAQVNPTVGDIKANICKVKEYVKRAEEYSAHIVAFPEMVVTGYPPEDLLLKPKFIEDNLRALYEFASSVEDTLVIVGFVDKVKKNIYNSAAIIYRGRVRGIYHKMFLSNYGVFDEKRYFQAGEASLVFSFGKVIFGVNIGEDIRDVEGSINKQAKQGARLIFILNASPFYAGKIDIREKIIRSQARRNKVNIAYINLAGGQDGLVFDGVSFIIDREGRLLEEGEMFKEDLLLVDLKFLPSKRLSEGVITVTKDIPVKKRIPLPEKRAERLPYLAQIYGALLLGLKDYVYKNGFEKVVIGLSGGIDSSLVATLACDALGRENVVGVFMPSPYTSPASREDVEELVDNLRIRLIKIPIDEIYKIFLEYLKPQFKGVKKDVTEENIQARIRGTILMALSNKFGWLVLTTGNKSEMACGYATLYGDMAGGFSVIKDVPKTLVYRLAHYRNTISKVIPDHILIKEPSAELKPNQKDKDSLPPYEILDPILKAYIEEEKSLEEIVSLGFERKIVEKVLTMVDKNEYKRRQSPPGIKITPRAFGKDRRMPITNKFK